MATAIQQVFEVDGIPVPKGSWWRVNRRPMPVFFKATGFSFQAGLEAEWFFGHPADTAAIDSLSLHSMRFRDMYETGEIEEIEPPGIGGGILTKRRGHCE